MNKSILALAIVAASTSVYAAPVENINPDNVVKELVKLTGGIDPRDIKEYKELGANLETPAEKAEYAKKILVSETSTNDFIKYVANRNEEAKQKMLDAHLIEIGKGGVIKINEESEHWNTINDKRNDVWEKHVEHSYGDYDGDGVIDWFNEDGSLRDSDLEAGVDPIDVVIDPIDQEIIVEPVPADDLPPAFGDQPSIPGVDPIDGEPQHISDEKKAEIKAAIVEKAEGKQPIIIDPIEPIVDRKAAKEKIAEKKAEREGNQPIEVQPIPALDRGAIKEAISDKKGEVKDELAEKKAELAENIEERKAEIKENVGELVGQRPIGTDPLPSYRAELGDAYNAYDDRLSNAEAQIDFNKQAIADLRADVDRLDEKMDSVTASAHAIANAKPALMKVGASAVGVGVGYAGDAAAIAVGVAHSFDDSWSASATVNATTGSYSEVSAGAGVAYQW